MNIFTAINAATHTPVTPNGLISAIAAVLIPLGF